MRMWLLKLLRFMYNETGVVLCVYCLNFRMQVEFQYTSSGYKALPSPKKKVWGGGGGAGTF